jgi:hypothetical protein
MRIDGNFHMAITAQTLQKVSYTPTVQSEDVQKTGKSESTEAKSSLRELAQLSISAIRAKMMHWP